jgi:aryl-alcohol dehydrogenase-like predicted oxidoreductase
MEYRNFGRTGVKVSRLVLGSVNFGTRTEEAESLDMIDHAIDQGINFIDTSNMYGRGVSETTIGKALKRNGQRERIVLATKVYYRIDDDDPNAQGNSRRHIIDQCEKSLKRLQTDWIDLYQIHRPQSEVPIDETLRALDDLVRAGKVRYIGCSTFAAWQVIESLWVAKELGLNRFVSEQPPYHLLDRRIERELIPAAVTYGLALIPWSPTAYGFLTGRYARGKSLPAGSKLERVSDSRLMQSLFSDASFDVLDTVARIAGQKGCTLSQLAIAWCLQQPHVTSPIIGPRTMSQLDDNLGSLDVVVTDEDRAALDQVAPPGQVSAQFYEADFGPHPHRW